MPLGFPELPSLKTVLREYVRLFWFASVRPLGHNNLIRKFSFPSEVPEQSLGVTNVSRIETCHEIR